MLLALGDSGDGSELGYLHRALGTIGRGVAGGRAGQPARIGEGRFVGDSPDPHLIERVGGPPAAAIRTVRRAEMQIGFG
jgi:hypothetical protein